MPLLGKDWAFSSIELVYLLLEIEKKFGISVPPEYLKDNYHITFNEILKEIGSLIESN